MITHSFDSTQNCIASTKSNAGLFLLFFIWPFVAFLLALSKYDLKDARRVVYLFLIYYGFAFTASNLAMDSSGFAENLKFTASMPFSEFWNIVAGIYATGTSVDIVQPFIIFLVSRLTDNSHFLFAVFAAVFGYFYLKSIDPIYQQYKVQPNQNALIHLVFFILVFPIFEINGFRWNTAAWVFFYGAYHVVVKGDRKFLIFSFFAAFIHFSYLSANFILLVYVLFGNRNYIYYALMILSFIIPELFAPQINQVALSLPIGLAAKYVAYSNNDYSNQVAELALNSEWFIKWPKLLVFYYIIVSMLFIQFKYRKLMNIKGLNNLFSFTLLFLSYSNFVKYIPSVGRFQTLFLLLGTAYLIFFYIRLSKQNIQALTRLGFLPLLIVVVVVFRVGLETMNIWVFAPWPFAAFAPSIPVASLIF